MLDTCKASCPKGCPRPAAPLGPKATAWLRDPWLREDLGPALAQHTARLVEAHEARLLLLEFMEPEAAAAKVGPGPCGAAAPRAGPYAPGGLAAGWPPAAGGGPAAGGKRLDACRGLLRAGRDSAAPMLPTGGAARRCSQGGGDLRRSGQHAGWRQGGAHLGRCPAPGHAW
jgi:hypothetical protein